MSIVAQVINQLKDPQTLPSTSLRFNSSMLSSTFCTISPNYGNTLPISFQIGSTNPPQKLS